MEMWKDKCPVDRKNFKNARMALHVEIAMKLPEEFSIGGKVSD
jgi:hypothetical protein